jgi:hypothetical protein
VSVAILDAAYMQRRARLRYMQAMSESFRTGYGLGPRGDTEESLREEYALGRLTFEQFERRLERMLGCT